MPTYEYACTACAERLEAVQSFSDPPLTECPSCGGALRKVFSAVGVVFKGSGFYKTDSRAANGAKPAEKKADAAPAATGADSGSSSAASAGSGSSGSGSSGSGSSADSASGSSSGGASAKPAASSTGSGTAAAS